MNNEEYGTFTMVSRQEGSDPVRFEHDRSLGLYPVESATEPCLIQRGSLPTRLIIGLLLLPFFPGTFDCLAVDFSADIRPILAEKCYQCHGPDRESRKADLRLDTREGAFADLGGYFAIKPGDSQNSEIVQRIFHDDADSIMPPPDFEKPLTSREKDLIEEWIKSGANWSGHWAFEKIARAEESKSGDVPAQNPIDIFIRKKHQDKGLKANSEADRYTLARRAALDIVGLPPTPEELKAFLSDRDTGAYQRYIDHLLASKHYGEHWARFWLDAARYSDTHGLHLDNYREMWPYRDWVIDAYNRNLPFDQFTVEQLAGDLLPSPTRNQIIATGFVRNNASSSEAGSIPEELRVRYMKDRTETMSTIFLGLTTGCAACHDHKFDPVSQKEFYQLGAFFNNSVDPPMDGNMRDTFPVMVVPSPENENEWKEIETFQGEVLKSLKDPLTDEIRKWWDESNPEDLLKTHPVPERGLAVYAPFDEGDTGKSAVYVKGEPFEIENTGTKPSVDNPNGNRGLHFLKSGGLKVPTGSVFQPNAPVTVSMWVRTPDDVKGLMLMSQWGEEDKDKKLEKTGWNIEVIPDGAMEMPLRDHTGTLCNTLMPSETPLKPNSWQHVAIRYSGGQAASSFTYFIDGEWKVGRRNWDTQISDRFGEHLSDILTIGPDAEGGGISDLRIFSRWLLDGELKLLADEFSWKNMVNHKLNWKDLTDDQRAIAERYYRCNEDKDSISLALVLGETKTRSDYLYARSTTTLVMKENETPAKGYVLNRGEYDQRTEMVLPNTPSVLPPLRTDGVANRLDLAKWLVNKENPLTARVTVNRIWQSLFGTGLVKTSEDFGIMGERPTHPELLDWLAAEFQESGWDTKALIRLIVSSDTYKQNSKFTPATLTIDPENRYLARGARRRLDAEVIRDQALAVTGILNPTMGGPSVKPYQPSGVWKAVAFEVSNTNEFKLDSIDKVHRRSLYTFWKRTAIPPAFAAFDAPSREECSVRRERTNTPLQALVLLNDEQHIEAARKLAETLISQSSGQSLENIANQAFSRVVGRPAEMPDIIDLVALAQMVVHQYESHPEEAKKLVSTGLLPVDESLDPISVAAWTVVINALLNRDDVINQS